MLQPCNINKCEQNSHVLCYCCSRNLCLDHLSNHRSLIDFQSFSLPDQINILSEQLKKLDHESFVDETRGKLEKWREESMKKLQRFYEHKCEELDRYFNQNIHQKHLEMNQLHKRLVHPSQTYEKNSKNENEELKSMVFHAKQRTDAIEQNGIPVTIQPLLINQHLITIGEVKTQEFDLSILSTAPSQTLNCSNKFGSAFACNDRHLLIDQNSLLTLYDCALNIIEQLSWRYGIISDMCWSSSLNSFILVTEKSQTYLVNGYNLSTKPIEAMRNQLWISCTCSNTLLYLASLSNGIVEFALLPSIRYAKRWDPPMTCQNDESIQDIACNDLSIALLVSSNLKKVVKLIVRSVSTFNQLFSLPLHLSHPSYQLPIRCCSFRINEWFISDANRSQIYHISKDGKIKETSIYDQTPYNLVVFNSNTLAVRTKETIDCFNLSY